MSVIRKTTQHGKPGTIITCDSGGATFHELTELLPESHTFLVERRGKIWFRPAPGGTPAWPWGQG